MEGENICEADDVFGLITRLCEQYTNNPQKIKTFRSKAYEILLKKRAPTCTSSFRNVKGTEDPMYNLVAWNFRLIHEFKLLNHAAEIKKWIERIEELCKEDQNNKELLYKPMQFLINLRNLPTCDTKKLDLSSLPPIDEHLGFDVMFKMPSHLLEEFEKSRDSSQNKKEDEPPKPIMSILSENLEVPSSSSVISDTEPDIWDMVLKMKFNNRRTWESYGYSDPDKEKPFLSEIGDLASLWIENLESLYIAHPVKYKFRTIPRKNFIRDLKHLLIGLASDSICCNQYGEFYLLPDINIEGVTPGTLSSFCRNLLYCGTCIKALTSMSTPGHERNSYKHQGYIYKEFCEGIARYLQFHRTAVFTIPDSTNCLEFDKITYPLQQKIMTLAAICKVTPPYDRQEEMPSGVALLNYLYMELQSLTEDHIVLVLCSILHACCQVYFSRFLIRWILEGVIEDPYGEFFVRYNSSVKTKGRAYWCKSYSIIQDIMPDFLLDCGMDILNCGKAMNLLRLCHDSSPLCLYLRGKKPLIISCCLTAKQLLAVKQNTMHYYFEVSKESGPKLDFDQVLLRPNSEDPSLIQLVAQKRSVTLRRLELQRLKLIEEQRERKMEEINILREQYETYLEQKQLTLVKEVQSEIDQIQEEISLEQKREKMIKEEANNMIEYYTKLMDTADQKKMKIKSQMKLVRSIHMDHRMPEKEVPKTTEEVAETSNSSSDSFYSIITEVEPEIEPESKLHTSDSMDVINANTCEESDDDTKNRHALRQQVIENFEMARKIKQKVLGVEYNPFTEVKTETIPEIPYLTEAQRNKLKVLSSEFGINVKTKLPQLSAQALLNRNKVMGVSECFQLDNASFVNKNMETLTEESSEVSLKKSKSLCLDLNRANSRSTSDRPVPMSVDSTPMSELPQSLVTTPSTAFMSIDTNQIESIPSTAETAQTNPFNLVQSTPAMHSFYERQKSSNIPPRLMTFSKRVTVEEAKGVSSNTLRVYLQECVQFPLAVQLNLVNDELLKYFINNLSYFEHLLRLRDYFFLQNGEFAHSITDNLFTRLYCSNSPKDLINFRTLQSLVFDALDVSGKDENTIQRLSFKINNIPACFDLGDPKVLECITLAYKVDWPLNVVLPPDTIGKYGDVFKFLLKLNRISWVLKTIFLELKILIKQVSTKKMFLLSSPHFRRLHQCRHVMTHFIQTLQNYIVGEVLQSSWETFVRSLADVKNLDQLYAAHTTYVKGILFKCLLSQKTEAFRKMLDRTFTVILKFYDFLRSRVWVLEDGHYVHPNFHQLESIFGNFEEMVAFFYKNVYKIAKCGYQPHLFQLLDALDVNNYISDSIKRSSA